jgi:tetratricopeptide (TPR) repeat protein
MTFDAFLESAWNDHGDRPQEVADRLAASLHLVEVPEHIPAFARLLTHVFGEHLGQWRRGIQLLEAMRTLPAFDGSSAVAGALTRNVATLSYASGDRSALASLGHEDRVCVLAAAATAFAGRNEFRQALATYSEALQLAESGLPPESPAIRALAVGGNNLAAALETKKDRNASETDGMVVAAQGGLTYWKQAGTWLEEERAEYRLARSLLQAGDAQAAIQSATRCIDVCKANDAPAFEEFFGYAVLAVAQRDAGNGEAFETSRQRALALLEKVPPDERQWCETEVDELGANRHGPEAS